MSVLLRAQETHLKRNARSCSSLPVAATSGVGSIPRFGQSDWRNRPLSFNCAAEHPSRNLQQLLWSACTIDAVPRLNYTRLFLMWFRCGIWLIQGFRLQCHMYALNLTFD